MTPLKQMAKMDTKLSELSGATLTLSDVRLTTNAQPVLSSDKGLTFSFHTGGESCPYRHQLDGQDCSHDT
jgi:hypothetical protein